MACSCCGGTCGCIPLRDAYFTLRVTVDPYNATASFPACPESVNNSTFSIPARTEETTFRLSNEPFCRLIAFYEGYASSGLPRPFYSVLSGRRVLIEASACQVFMKIDYAAYPLQESLISCSLGYSMQRWHFEIGGPQRGYGTVNDLNDTDVSVSRTISSSASELVGLKAISNPLTNPDCVTPGSWPNLPTYSFCESGGKLTAEIVSVSLLP